MFSRSNHKDKKIVLVLAQKHLTLLKQKYDYYFFTNNTEQYDWIRNPFASNVELSTQEFGLWAIENFLEQETDQILGLKFNDEFYFQMWLNITHFRSSL